MDAPPSPPVEKRRFDAGYLRLLHDTGFTAAETAAGPYRPAGRYTENIVQLVWRNGLYDGGAMKTSAGNALKVVSPGRFNRSSGPDFKNAALEIDGERVAGDIEIHKHAREWYEHKHHLSPLYDHTVLHVFVERSENTPAAVTKKGRTVRELEIGLYLRHPIEELGREVESAESPLSGRPFTPPCAALVRGLSADTVPKLLDFVGDGRALLKSNRAAARLSAAPPEQVFYEMLFETLGYSRFNTRFGALARAMPLERLRSLAADDPSLPPAVASRDILLRLAGLYEPEEENGPPRPETVPGGTRPLFGKDDWPLARCRPANYPHRRIAALCAMMFDPAFSIPALKQNISALPLAASFEQTKSFAKRMLAGFTAVSDPFWDRHYTFRRPAKAPKKLVGADKAGSIMIDAVIPILLASARGENDLDMEHRLVLLYHALPAPSSNAVIDFMVKTALGHEHRGAARTVPRQQALLQIYKDFCHGSPASCAGCPFVEYLKSLRADSQNRRPAGA